MEFNFWRWWELELAILVVRSYSSKPGLDLTSPWPLLFGVKRALR